MSRRARLQPTLWRIDPHTTIKHLVYRHYLGCWMGKVLQKFPEASIIDGFAGPGEYECGADGSPVIIAKLFLDHTSLARFKHLYLYAQEYRPDRVEHLIRRVASLRHDPRLHIDVRDPASFTDERTTLSALAHGDSGRRPVLWILDPYNWEPVPFDIVVNCLRAGRDELLLTLFVDEVYRFRRSDAHIDAISRYLGLHPDDWLYLRDITEEQDCKRAIIELYCRNLAGAAGVMTGHFSIAVKNQTPRYAIVFATHNKAGMQCWTPVTWRLDERGGAIKGVKPDQLDLFVEDVDPASQLAIDLAARFAGGEAGWEQLTEIIRANNYLDKHLREALSSLATDGLALRVEPLDSRSPWPDGCVVRFYTPTDVAEG